MFRKITLVVPFDGTADVESWTDVNGVPCAVIGAEPLTTDEMPADPGIGVARVDRFDVKQFDLLRRQGV